MNPGADDRAESYAEDGLVIFTAYFLLRRGECCGSGCRHCPYDERTGRPRAGYRERYPELFSGLDAVFPGGADTC